MIRQRNMDPLSMAGVHSLFLNPLISAASVSSRQAMGIPISNVDKVQLIDLTLLVTTAIGGTGSLGFDIYKAASNVVGSTAGTIVKACMTAVVAVGLYKTDLRDVAPIDPRGLLTATPNDFLLQISWNNTGTVSSGAVQAMLRYRPFYTTKDS